MEKQLDNFKNFNLKKIIILTFIGFAILTILTIIIGPNLSKFYPLGEDQGASWYYWQLPETSTIIRISYWVGYALHQLSVWIIVILAMRKMKGRNSSDKANIFNIVAIVVNLIFGFLHLLQTQFFYDGLAQDMPIWTSQGSVIVMLILVLYMMIPYRGLFWGKKFKPPVSVNNFIRKWHGLYISWALVFTFWFHPMEGNWGLLSGFIYMFLLFIQLSLFNTKFHFNKTWIVIIEVFVTIHAFLITVYKENPIWTMFLYGFLIMFVLTQMHIWKMPNLLKVIILILFIASIGLVYGFIRGFNYIYELSFIPVALYGGVLFLLMVGWIIDKFRKNNRKV